VAHAIRGMTLEDAGERPAALAPLRRAHELSPGDAPMALTLAQVLERAGQREEAFRLVEGVLANDSRSADAWFLRGLLAMRRPGRAATAETSLQRALALDANHARSHAALGSLRLRQGRWGEARVHLERAHSLRPADPGVAGDLAVAYRHLGDSRAVAVEQEAREGERSEAQWREVRRRHRAHPEDRAVTLQLATMERDRGNAIDALERVRALLSHDPNDAAALKLMHELMQGG
jgi:Flp pilus assembly protein TadD